MNATWQRGYLVSCACNPATGSQCQFHARQPRPCPTGCGGQLNYQAEGQRREPGQHRTSGIRTCNQCEHCE